MKRNKIFILISLVFFVLYFFIIYSTYTENKAYFLQSIRNNQIKLVHAYKEKFDERLAGLKRIVETMGENLVKKDRKKDFAAIKEALSTAISSGAGFKSVYIGYPDDYLISGLKYWYHTSDYFATKRSWYKEAVEEKKTIISKPYSGSPGFEDKIYISIASPIYKNNQLLAVMSSDLELELVQKEVSKLFSIDEGFAFLMTKNAEVITPSNNLGIDFEDKKLKEFLSTFSNKEIGEKRILIENKLYIFTYETLDNSDWFFVSVLDENKIYKSLNHQLFLNLLAAFVLFIFGLGTFLYLSITQKKLYEKHLLLGHFAKSPTWGVLLTDKEGKIIFINKVFEEVFSLKSKSLYNKPLDSIIDILKCSNSNQISCFQDIKNNLLKMKSYLLEKEEKIYRVQITPLLNNYQEELEGAIVTIHDVTHERELEQKEVEQEQILIQNSKMAALGEMVSAISHQWRQPLSTLLMLISNTEEIIEKQNLPKVNNYLNRARGNIELMDETINAFRNFYKEDFGKDKFDLVKIIKEIILITSPQMQMNGIELKFIYDEKNSYSCESYPSYIKQVLINLIGNAKDELVRVLKDKFLYEAKINIALSKKDGCYLISVEDNGSGISNENKNKIFEPFFTTKGEQGTGTGLYLCKLLIENKMNGEFKLENLSKPTKFTIKIGKSNV